MKALSSPASIGVFAGAIGFIFLWPKSPQEGFSRIFCAGINSHFFGESFLRTIVNFAPWIQPDDIRAGAYLLAGALGWVMLGGVFNFVKKNTDKDIFEMFDSTQYPKRRISNGKAKNEKK